MAKEVAAFIKLQIKGGAANPSPPVGPALGSKGVNIMDFCKQFNARTQDKAGKVLPVIITVYSDKSFDFVVKQPPVAVQLKEAAKAQKGSAQPNRDKVGQVTWDQVREIAQDKMPDMNCFTLEAAMRMVAGVELLKTRARRVGNHARQRRFARSGRSIKNQRSELICLDRPVQKLILSYDMLLSHHLVKRGRAQPGCQRCLLLDRIFPHIIK